MALSRIFARRRPGVSELYAAVLMIGVTLSLGSLVVAAATSQFGLTSESASLSASLSRSSAGIQMSLVYAAVAPNSTCPSYQGYLEGTELTLGVYDYGSEGFAPAGFVVNSTDYAGAFAASEPGALTSYTIGLSTCAHGSGLTVLAYSAAGEVAQFGT